MKKFAKPNKRIMITYKLDRRTEARNMEAAKSIFLLKDIFNEKRKRKEPTKQRIKEKK
jgi:hypothetical protein